MIARDLVARRGSFTLSVRTLEAQPGGTAVLGPNGAGKTTLLLALHGLIAATGSVERTARTASVFARPAMLRGSALWNVATIRRNAVGDTADGARERAIGALRDVGLGDALETDARMLSTGQRQRLALARALVIEPRALLLDEPFANVDADGRPALRALVRSYAERTACDVVLATSSLADAAALCRYAVVLRDGGVRYAGTLAALETSTDSYVRALLDEFSAGPLPARASL